MDTPNGLEAILRCPCCHAPVRQGRCANDACASASGFLTASGQLVLIDFEHSIFDAAAFADQVGSVMKRDNARTSLRSVISHLTAGPNTVAKTFAERIRTDMKSRSVRPRLLIIGGGALGSGAEPLYDDPDVDTVGIDVYASPFTTLVADGHALPFVDASFEGVWIQAVLEHVLDPAQVVAEIHRVLKPDGLVYADTPFMQQVHEGAYDFTRFTLSGHRWLFRSFTEVATGVVSGVGTSAIWSARYLLRGMGLAPRWAYGLTLPLFPLRFMDRIGSVRTQADGASGVYFYGSRAQAPIGPKAMVAFYAAQGRRAEPQPALLTQKRV